MLTILRKVRLCGLAVSVATVWPMILPAQDVAKVEVPIVYLRQDVDRPPVLSNLDPVPDDLGIAGAEVALEDAKTTGTFMGHDYSLDVLFVPPGGDLSVAADEALKKARLILVEGSGADILTMADRAAAKDALIFNVSSGEEALRSSDCRANLLHTAAEDAARSDALMQFLVRRQWPRAVMITGPQPADADWAAKLRKSAEKFGVQILAEKAWTFDTDLRESTMDEIPRFTQDFPDHDVLIVADATDDFGRYVEHNAWLPRPVVGSDGLVATAWAPVIEAWGAVQLQNRFEDHAGRTMRGQDYAAWVAIRTIGEAVTRTNSADVATLRAHILSDAFALDGFKGRALSYRGWNGQLRQPIALANARALVALAPLDGYLHQVNETDTLGLDEPASACTAFKE
ncbi:MAG: ABC transporter substrate-binding protein [Paracoccaceae bacterium]